MTASGHARIRVVLHSGEPDAIRATAATIWALQPGAILNGNVDGRGEIICPDFCKKYVRWAIAKQGYVREVIAEESP